jgi:hypothetical protein
MLLGYEIVHDTSTVLFLRRTFLLGGGCLPNLADLQSKYFNLQSREKINCKSRARGELLGLNSYRDVFFFVLLVCMFERGKKIHLIACYLCTRFIAERSSTMECTRHPPPPKQTLFTSIGNHTRAFPRCCVTNNNAKLCTFITMSIKKTNDNLQG